MKRPRGSTECKRRIGFDTVIYPLARDCQIPAFCPCAWDLANPLEPNSREEISAEVY